MPKYSLTLSAIFFLLAVFCWEDELAVGGNEKEMEMKNGCGGEMLGLSKEKKWQWMHSVWERELKW